MENSFEHIAALVCEPPRAKMLWSMLDGRSYSAGELAIVADVSATGASNHLSKLLQGGLVTVNTRGRHRFYQLANPDVAYAIEALASLARPQEREEQPKQGIHYCRSCYDHLAGYVGVSVTDAMVRQGYLRRNGLLFTVTTDGWRWFEKLNIKANELPDRRPIARQCLDWSERRSHLAGSLGAALLDYLLGKRWLKKDKYSRELHITSVGNEAFYDNFRLVFS